MRPFDKGIAPKTYTNYGDARHDLANVIGYFCSYCEMATWNMIEVEHIHPVNNGGNPLSWDNFLLSCKYCNTIKSDNNQNRQGYIWPDTDNTDLAFVYDEVNIISPKVGLSNTVNQAALATIQLMGLNRAPHLPNQPTEADTRWRSKMEAWDKAKRSLNNWNNNPSPEMAETIAMTTTGGHFSIWCTVFQNHPQVINAIIAEHPSTYSNTNNQNIRILRPNGII